MDTTIRNDVDIRTHLRSSVLAAVPASSREIEDGATPDFVTQTHPRSHAAEAFRALRTALAFRLRNRPLRSLAISSTFPQEGKSVISINLAIAEAQVGKRTLLVDTDMRKPRLHLAFRVTAPTGIADWLSSTTQAPPQSLAIKTSIPNLFFLPCGTIPANPVELLDSPRFLELVKHLETHFDIVIFDSPPSFSLVDALVTAKALDGLLLVTRSFSTPKAPAQQVCDHMRDGGVTLLGVVLNNVDLPHHAYYYYGSGMHGKLLPYYEEPAPDPDHASKSIRGWFQGLFPTPRKPKE
jgi:capsular exopolysaccharide synthesis family protein